MVKELNGLVNGLESFEHYQVNASAYGRGNYCDAFAFISEGKNAWTVIVAV